jgi:fructoselysine-6-P-deglycase FrlB-like protein
MTHFLRDIFRQPKELQRTFEFLLASGTGALEAAKNSILSARHVYLTGIGSSWHAALTAGPLFYGGGRPVYMLDAAELQQRLERPDRRATSTVCEFVYGLPLRCSHFVSRNLGHAILSECSRPDQI